MNRIGNGNLLVVANFPSGTGYAWKTIAEYFARLGELFRERGRQAFIAYPRLGGELPGVIRRSPLHPLEFDFCGASLPALIGHLRRKEIGYLYLTDQPSFSGRYLLCRLAGVRRIVLHDRTSGHRDIPGELKKRVKRALNRSRLLSADLVIAISDYVRNRVVQTGCVPEEKVMRIWNGIDLERFRPGCAEDFPFDSYGIPRGRQVVVTCARANSYKGIGTLIDAAERIVQDHGRGDIHFLFCGDGPDLEAFRAQVRRKGLEDYFTCPGRVEEIPRLLAAARLVVVPSLWEEGFGLSAAEGMACGRAVIASRTGGMVEIIEEGRNGLHFKAGDDGELSRKILHLCDSETLLRRLGIAARQTVEEKFNLADKKEELAEVFSRYIDEESCGAPAGRIAPSVAERGAGKC